MERTSTQCFSTATTAPLWCADSRVAACHTSATEDVIGTQYGNCSTPAASNRARVRSQHCPAPLSALATALLTATARVAAVPGALVGSAANAAVIAAALVATLEECITAWL